VRYPLKDWHDSIIEMKIGFAKQSNLISKTPVKERTKTVVRRLD